MKTGIAIKRMSVFTTLEEVQRSFRHLEKDNSIAIDTETTHLRLDLLALLGVSIATKEHNFYIDLHSSTEKSRIINYLSHYFKKNQKRFIYVMHNAVFDLKVLGKYGIRFDNALIYDTMTAEHLIDERKRKGLKDVAKRRLGVETQSFKDAQHQGYGSQKFLKYALNDSRWTYDIYKQQVPELKAQGVWHIMRRVEMPYVHCLLQMKETGMYVDTDELQRQTRIAEDMLADLNTRICDVTGLKMPTPQVTLNGGVIITPPINFNSSAQLSKLLYEDLGLECKETTPSGAPSVSSSALKALKGQHPVIPLLLKRSKLMKLKTSFLESIPDYLQGNVVRPGFITAGPKTGRLSCRSPNLQQLPRQGMGELDIRKIFSTPKGYKMISCDYSGQENRVAAHVCDDKEFKRLIREGKDMHLVNANAVFDLGLTEKQTIKGTKEHAKAKKKYKQQRTQAKVFSFGILYGATHHRVMNEFDCSEEEAKAYVNNYFKMFKGVAKKKEETRRFLKRNEYVKNIIGRRRRFNIKSDFELDHALRKAFNFLIQGPCSDILRVASVKVLNLSRNNPEWGLKQVATVHDENVYIVKEKYANEVAKKIEKLFESSVKLSLPLPAESDVGDNYSQAK